MESHDHSVELLPEAITFIADRFDLAYDADDHPIPAEGIASFRKLLADALRDIIDHRFARLPQLLYRLDLSEKSVDEIFRTAPFSEVPEALADLIIERVMMKMETRRKYREGISEEGG